MGLTTPYGRPAADEIRQTWRRVQQCRAASSSNLNFDSAYNVYLGLPGDGDALELTVNVGRDEPYDLGEGYNHIALTVDYLDAVLARLRDDLGVEPERAPYRPGGRDDLPNIAFVADPDGYRIELIDGGRFDTPVDPVDG